MEAYAITWKFIIVPAHRSATGIHLFHRKFDGAMGYILFRLIGTGHFGITIGMSRMHYNAP